MAPNAIVHIGFNKCGSTAIQKWLAANRGKLAREGIAYRRTDPRPLVACANPQFVELAFSLADRPTPPRPMSNILGYRTGDLVGQRRVADAFAEDYTEWVQSHGLATTVISNEALGPLLSTPGLAAALDTWLRTRFGRVHYIAYIREPLAWLISRYGHARRQGNVTCDIDTFLKRQKRTPFWTSLDTWRQAVGRQNLEVRLFDEEWLSEPGLISDFSERLGLDPRGQERRAQRANLSYFPAPNIWDFALRRLRRRNTLQDRPVPSAASVARVEAANRADLDRLEQTFFADRPDEFRAWAHQPVAAGR